MATRPTERPGRLSVEAAAFYARLYAPARAGCLDELRRSGCGEEEAEEVFAATFERIMGRRDPLAEGFSAPQAVCLLKQACRQRLVDERRHRGALLLVPLEAKDSEIEADAEGPAEAAEEREAVAIGREAIASLPNRDRALFLQRHAQGLSPEEILRRNPGLTQRTYRKVMQRANARALAAFGEIVGGARCDQMQGEHLRRYVAGDAKEEELAMVKAHLSHCRACRLGVAEMRGHLHDIAAGLSAALAGDGAQRGLHADLPARVFDVAGHGGDALVAATRAVRERLRDLALRAATALPGSGGDTAGQLAGISGAKAASVCAAGAVAVSCLAAGVVPGVGALGLAEHHRHPDPPKPKAVRASVPPATLPPSPVVNFTGSQPSEITTRSEDSRSAAKGKTSAHKTETRTRSPARPTTSASQTATEFGVESAGTGSPATSGSTESSAGGGGSSGGTAVGPSRSAGGSTREESAAEFGL